MDWLGWKTTLRLLQQYPELIAAALQFALVCGGAVWWYRDHTANNRIATLRTTHDGQIAALNTRIAGLQDSIASLEERLRETREDRSALKDDLRLAKEEQERLTRELSSLRDENTKLVSEIGALQATAPQSQQPQLTIIYKGASAIAVGITSASKANTALGSTLSEIAYRLEAKDLTVGSPTSTKPTLTPRSE